MSEPKETIAVIGAGLMGHGIAYLLAAAGHEVKVQDPVKAAIDALPTRIAEICDLLGTDKAAIGKRITGHLAIKDAVTGVDIVIEAAPEKLPLKQSIFADLEMYTRGDTILASNTSVIPITNISAEIKNKTRVLGAHFWNPPHLVPLVEVVMMDETNRPAAEKLMAVLKAAGQHPVLVKKDIPGFIGNRLQHALKREAIALVANGICDAETVDDVVKIGFGSRLGVLGPLEQSDMVGLNLTKDIHDTVIQDLDVTPHTHPYLNELVAKGDLGMKTGKGFRTWTPESAQAVRDRLKNFLAKATAEAKAKK